MWILWGTVFIASLLGSLHCVGMCGPFALIASSGTDAQQPNRVGWGASMYSLGRLSTYSIVGGLFGGLGLVINQGASLASWQQVATLVAGGLMIAVGVIALARHLGWTIRLPKLFGGRLQIILQQAFHSVRQMPTTPKAFLIGALSCLMPCGWLYTFAIVAAGTGGVLSGVSVMVAFWAGTVPIMLALMLGYNRIGQSLQKRIPLAMSLMVILIGVFTIAVRAPVSLANQTGPESVLPTDDLVQMVNQIDHDELPCCQGE